MRTHLVTGSASGIGKAARALQEARGDKVIGVDLRDAEICLDLADPTERATLGARIAALGVERLDGVLAAAGVGGSRAAPDLVVRLNFFGVIETLQQVQQFLRRSEAPRACAIASIALMNASDADADVFLNDGEQVAIAAFASRTGVEAYSATKRALAYWVRRNAADWASDRITLNAIAPGLINTAMTSHIDAARQAVMLEEMGQALGPGAPEDVATLAAYLLSAENRLMTGQVLYVDGGHEALRGAQKLHTHG